MSKDKGIVKPILTIGLNEAKEFVVIGPMDRKELCLMAIAQAIQVIVQHEASPIVKPAGVA